VNSGFVKSANIVFDVFFCTVVSATVLFALAPAEVTAIFLFPYLSARFPCAISNEIFPLYSLYSFPFSLPCSIFVNVSTCLTSFAFVVAFCTVVAIPKLLPILVSSVPFIYTLMFPAANELVKLLTYVVPASEFVLPLNVIITFLFASSTVTDSFIHSVLYFGLIVPFV